ncbi:ankyrin [mine drainage metagenome]|uniref:Ankyrin n=1 Tax=mine drainage metagenome TaxID=410659 RepID=T1ASL5_9ZZZZ
MPLQVERNSVVKKLLEAGASVDLMNLDDFTALDMASSLECLNLLRPLNSSRKVQLIKTGSTGD